MKREFGYSDGDNRFVIWSHAGLFHLRNENNENDIAKADNILILKAWIDGFTKGESIGLNKYFNKYMELKQTLKRLEIK